MSFIGDLRTLVYLRRIARAEERQADALDELRAIERSRWQREAHIPPSGRPLRKTEIGTFDVAAANESYLAELQAREFGATLEDISVASAREERKSE